MSLSMKTTAAKAEAPARDEARDGGFVWLFIRAVNGLSLICGILAAIGIAVAVALVCQLVFVRYVLNASTVWQTEVVIYLMIGATLLGAPYVQRARGHVNVDLLPIYLRGRARFVLYYLCLLLAMVVCLIVAYYGFEMALEAYVYNWRSPSVWGAALWPSYSAIPIGFFVWFLQLLADFLAVATGRDKPFGIDDEEDATDRALRKEH
ncbi:TRAP transporter small permease [Telmatospirillum sp. J64-1]|uniref:TRAP transporter small permease n=1 Tax=Telmatospirillum sp. J64-1 TaxID=2502183 RepID=UPI00163D6085|nr:TRAP transporter small permease [Telmatospirillum sp. J64-1]